MKFKWCHFSFLSIALLALLQTTNLNAQKGYFTLISSDSLPFIAEVNDKESDSLVTKYTWRHTESEVLWVKIFLPTLNKRVEKMLFINLGKNYEYQLDNDGLLTSIIQPEEDDFYKLDFKAPLFTFGEELKTKSKVVLSKLKEIENPAPYLKLSPKLNTNDCQLLSDLDFEDAQLFISASLYADSRLSIAKQIAESNCISSKQLVAVLALFKHENSRLEFLMFAYDHVIDPSNYGMAINSLRYEFTRDKFEAYLNSL
jgi:hypothetical protein